MRAQEGHSLFCYKAFLLYIHFYSTYYVQSGAFHIPTLTCADLTAPLCSVHYVTEFQVAGGLTLLSGWGYYPGEFYLVYINRCQLYNVFCASSGGFVITRLLCTCNRSTIERSSICIIRYVTEIIR